MYLLPQSLIALTALAAPADPLWIPLPGGTNAPPGTEPTIEVIEGFSNSHLTVLDVRIPGFWATPTDVDVGDGFAYPKGMHVFTRLSLPARPSTTEDLGAPELPVLRIPLAAEPGAPSMIHLAGFSVPGMTELSASFDEAELAGLASGAAAPRIYPVHVPEWDGDPDAGTPNGIPEQFQYDKTKYDGFGSYPPTNFDATTPVGRLFMGVDGATVELRPFRWRKGLQQLDVLARFVVAFQHAAPAGGVPPTITIHAAEIAGAYALNYETVSTTYQQNHQSYDGRYLIVTDLSYLTTLVPFVQHRQQTGYDVQVRLLGGMPDTSCASIRAAIGQWYAAGDPSADHYCLLVGDEAEIPRCPANSAVGTLGDDMYGSPFDGDLDEEVYVGRLSIDDDEDLAHQLAKIMSYERDASVDLDYADIPVAAHLEDSPGKYEGAMLDLIQDLNATFSSVETQWLPGSFVTFTTNAKVIQYVEEEAGFLLYRGHGSSGAWSSWNWTGQDLIGDDVDSIVNDQYPIHWSITCSNGNISSADCIAERWMEAQSGASAAYAAVRSTKTSQNHEIARYLSMGAFDASGTTHGIVIAYAEAVADALFAGEYDESNTWRYLLLGDPAMAVRTDDEPPEPSVDHQDDFVFDQHGTGSVDVGVHDAAGNDLDGTLVSLVIGEPSVNASGDLVPPLYRANAYVGGGTASFDVELPLDKVALAGTKAHVGIRLPGGYVETHDLPLVAGGFELLGGGIPDATGETPTLLSLAAPKPGKSLAIRLSGAETKSTALFFVSFVHQPVAAAGGVLHTNPPALALPLATDKFGEATLAGGPMPPEWFGSGIPLVFQTAVGDPDSPLGFTLSNGLKTEL